MLLSAFLFANLPQTELKQNIPRLNRINIKMPNNSASPLSEPGGRMMCLTYLMFAFHLFQGLIFFSFVWKVMFNALIHGVWRELAYIDLPKTLTVMSGALKLSIPIYLPSFRIQECCIAPVVGHFSFPTISKIAAGDLQAITHIKYSSSFWRDLCDTNVCLPILSGQPHRS